MPEKISAVINTLNEEVNIRRAIESVKWADEVVVCDMHSDDETVKIAKDLGSKVIFHKRMEFVEPARNFAISKVVGDWILILDADEEIPESLSERLQEIVRKGIASDFVEVPRKNIIFGRWIKYSGWWPDYQVRFFKKGAVLWNDQIHSRPETKGVGLKLEPEEKWAIIHHNYRSVSDFIERMNRYSGIQAQELIKSGYKFKFEDIFEKPMNEFLSRYFANQGYKDGLHGLVLSLLQAFSFSVLYLKVWEVSKFKEQDLRLEDFEEKAKIAGGQINYWLKRSKGGALKKFLKILKNND